MGEVGGVEGVDCVLGGDVYLAELAVEVVGVELGGAVLGLLGGGVDGGGGCVGS